MLTTERIAAYYQTPHTPNEPQASITLSPIHLAELFGEGARAPSAEYLTTLLLMRADADASRQRVLADVESRATKLLSRLFPKESEESEGANPLDLLLSLLETRPSFDAKTGADQ